MKRRADASPKRKASNSPTPTGRWINFLRDYYLENGLPESGREISDALDARFTGQGGRKYLRRLFPEGPVAQGMRIAGLPVPAYTEDESFGVSR
jgi:sulfur relay (sulfurtransferase) DsrC/TusE family protein